VIGSSRNLAVWALDRPADMRKSFDGLMALARDVMDQKPLSGDLFLFVSKDQRRAKVLYWDGTGLCVLAKRLEQGRFVAPWSRKPPLTLTASELALFLEGSTVVGKMPLSPPLFPLS